jgi:kinesin family member 5
MDKATKKDNTSGNVMVVCRVRPLN